MLSSPQTAADADPNSEGASPMPIRLLAFALLAGICVAHAAPPKSKTPAQDAASAQPAPEAIDVDALARSKDVDGSTPADANAPPTQTSETPPPAEAVDGTPPTDAPPVEAAPSEAPPVNTRAEPPIEAPPTATSEAAVSAEKKEASEKISVAGSCQARATSLLDDAEKADFKGATSAFNAKMHGEMPPQKFKDAWEQLAQFGKLVARGQSHLSAGEGYTLVMIPLIFEKANLVAQIACGTDGRIAGFYVKPVPTPAPNS
jgi:hypothetical protein